MLQVQTKNKMREMLMSLYSMTYLHLNTSVIITHVINILYAVKCWTITSLNFWLFFSHLRLCSYSLSICFLYFYIIDLHHWLEITGPDLQSLQNSLCSVSECTAQWWMGPRCAVAQQMHKCSSGICLDFPLKYDHLL